MSRARHALAAATASLSLVAGGCAEDPTYLLIGHRGAPLEALENSIASFARARDLGADGIELDVQLTADGKLVVLHDLFLDRTTVCQGSVRDRTLEQLRACPLKNGEPLQTLDAVLTTIGPWFSLVFVEIKTDEPFAFEQRADEAARVVLASGWKEKVVITCYEEAVLRRLATRCAEGIIAAADDFTNVSLSNAVRFRVDWALLRVDGVEGREGAIASGTNKQLCVYSVDTKATFLTATRAGASVLMTDTLPLLNGLLGRGRR